MSHEVFISHAKHDRAIADEMAVVIEKHGLGCWLATRDAPLGESWPEAIANAIENCQAMVLIFSSAAMASDHVEREMTLADTFSKPIIEFRVEDVAPTGAFAYYFLNKQMADAIAPPVEGQLDRLADRLKEVLAVGAVAVTTRREDGASDSDRLRIEKERQADRDEFLHNDRLKRLPPLRRRATDRDGDHRRRPRVWLWSLIAIAVTAAVAAPIILHEINQKKFVKLKLSVGDGFASVGSSKAKVISSGAPSKPALAKPNGQPHATPPSSGHESGKFVVRTVVVHSPAPIVPDAPIMPIASTVPRVQVTPAPRAKAPPSPPVTPAPATPTTSPTDWGQALMQAASSGNVGRLTDALNHGANVNATDDSGNTPLMRAVAKGNLGAVRVLLSWSGIDVNMANSQGQTALKAAEELKDSLSLTGSPVALQNLDQIIRAISDAGGID